MNAPGRARAPRASGVRAALILATLATLAGCGALPGRDAVAVPRFVDEAAAAGVVHAYEGEYAHFVGGGVAVFDCDDDGMPDLYLAGGTAPAALYRNVGDVGGPLRFAPVPSPVTDLVAVTGAYPLDVDGDGRADLAVLRRGVSVLLRGLGDCRFEDATEALGLPRTAAWTTAFAATWEPGATLPTLAFGRYLVPDTLDCDDNVLLRPEGARYGAPVALPAHCTLSLLVSDWDRTGRRDLRVSNDRNYSRDAVEQLWALPAGAPPREYGAADGWRALTIWGMGIASQDLTGDGRPEVYLTSQGDHKLQELDEGATGPAYRDVALARGVTAHRPYVGGDVLPSTGWHAEFDDVNNDGRMDLFVAKGNVEAQVDYAANDPNNLLLGRADGTFEEAGDRAGIATAVRSRGAALADLNLDGLLDLVVVNRRVPVELWRNVGAGTADAPAPMGRWLAVRPRDAAPNVDGIGAWIEVRTADGTVARERTVGGGHASGELGWVHVGLGDAARAEVRVTFPGDAPGPWMAVDADRFVEVRRGATAAVAWTPPGP